MSIVSFLEVSVTCLRLSMLVNCGWPAASRGQASSFGNCEIQVSPCWSFFIFLNLSRFGVSSKKAD